MGLNKLKKGFLDMEKAKLFSKSIILVDDKFNGLPPTNTTEKIQVDNPFKSLSNILFLKSIIGKDGFKTPQSNEFTQTFIFGDFIFTYDLFPPKFKIEHNTSDEKSEELKEIANKIISFAELNKVIGAIGINYEYYIENEDNHIILKNEICNTNISNAFSRLNTTLVYDGIDDYTTLNLQITDATIKGKKSIYISSNFHNKVEPTNRIEDIFKKDFKKRLDEKLEVIFTKKSKK